MTNQTVLVLDFGGKTKENVAKMIRECRVYSRIVAFDIPTEEIKAVNPIGLVLVGDSADVNDSASPKCRPELFELNIPVLGIGYGMHAMTYALMGRVESRKKDENGRVKGLVDVTCPLFAGVAEQELSVMLDCLGAKTVRAEKNGVVFLAVVRSLGELPESEMKETGLFEDLPGELTYPMTSPVLYREAEKALKKAL